MKLLFLADGNRAHTQNIINYFVDKGYEIDLITNQPTSNKAVRVHLIPDCQAFNGELKRFWYIRKALVVRRLIQKIKPDILHALYVTNFGFLGAVSGIRPFILTAYGTDILRTPQKNRIYRCITRYALKRADLVHSVAPHVSEEIVKMKITIQKILTYRFFVDLSRFVCTREIAAAQSRYTVLSIRNWDQNANLATLVQAIPSVLNKKNNVWFVFICNEESRKKLLALAQQLKISQHVAFPGIQPHAQMNLFYQESDIFVSVALSDGMPNCLLEALACGTFPIVSRTRANAYWVENGTNGFTVPPTDSNELAQKILLAIDDAELRTRAREINQRKIQKLPTFEKNLEDLEYYYFKLMNNKKAK